MIRVGFTFIGGKNWTGGYNYLLNLVRALSEHAYERVQPVLFLGTDISEKEAGPFERIGGVSVIRSAVFDEANKGKRLRQALLTGCDRGALRAYSAQGISVVFESAQFYGWRFPLPAVAWFPDFQHRHLRNLFDFRAYWKREIGFRTQIMSGRQIMLSSEDARQDCERFYPSTCGRTHVVRFAVPAATAMDAAEARAIADGYGLPKSFFFLPNQFWRHKNHECVIQALALLKSKGREVVVAASGKQVDPRDPEHFPRLRLLIENYGLAKNFRLLGLIPHEHIHALMQCCTALINPSNFEGWSTTVEEAKAMGTPMILSSLRVHREQSESAVFFDPNSPVQLAGILDDSNFDKAIECLTMRGTASQLGTTRMKIFSSEFAGLMELASKSQ